MLVRHGAICKECKTGCANEPSQSAPLWLKSQPCDVCGGGEAKRTCQTCLGRGWLKLTSCPKRQIAPETWDWVRMFLLADKGVLPVGGGALDQCETFLEAWQAFAGLEAKCEASSDG